MPPRQPSQTRAWGSRYDTLPSSPPVSPEAKRDEVQSVLQDTSISSDSQGGHKDHKQPHDASVFVGSLPSNVDQAELTRLLTGHLSEHAEIKSIKVIRDSKGGVCAFVQCGDATSASVFLQSLRSSPPKPFLGRILRYEPARAFRTLLISYRAPSQAIIPQGINRIPPRAMDDILGLGLPHAIRLWKPRNTKYHRIIYNAEAIEAERYARALSKEDATSASGEAVYLHPLKFDAESIVRLARYFGPLETVSDLTEVHELAKAPENGVLTPQFYPPPHNALRSKGMDAGCWKVKWNHRDDCVAALMALRRVPHLSVSWAHQPHSSHHAEQRSHSQLQGCQDTINHTPRVQSTTDQFQPYNSPCFVSPLSPTAVGTEISPSQSLHQSSAIDDNRDSLPNSATGFGIDGERVWTSPVTPPVARHKSACDSSVTRDKPLDQPLHTRSDWTDSDSPLFAGSEYESKTDWNTWGDIMFEKEIKASIIASQSVCEISSPQRPQISPLLRTDSISTPGLAMSPASPRTTLSQTPITPVTRSFGLPFSDFKSKENVLEPCDISRADREIDPTTLFVGGLEMLNPGAWTEEKVKAIFGRFGGLEFVKFIRPPNGNAAFAFVKYNNRESPARAIMEENNRVYAGRALKVQLRDVNPPRSPWRQNRGRGRFLGYQACRKVMLSNGPMNHVSRQEHSSVAQGISDNDIGSPQPASQDMSRNETDEVQSEISPLDKPQEKPLARVLENTQTERYREWYDAPGPGAAPVPEFGNIRNGPTGVPLMTPPMPYPVAPGYYPIPWIPYAQPGHYQMPYYGPYPAYPMPGPPVPPFSTTPPDSDASSPVAGPHPWPNMMYNPFVPYFAPQRAVGGHQSPPAPSPGPQVTPVSQAPLTPSGFIQNDQGTLIAVYPPDALDQYMSGRSNGSSSDSNPSTSTQSISTTSAWPSTQNLPESASTCSAPTQAGNNSQRLYPVSTHPLWNAVPQPFLPMPPGLGSAAPTYNLNAAAQVRNHHDHSGTNLPSADFGKRPGNRRDFQQHNGNRSSRSFNTRSGRGHLHNSNLIGNTEGFNSHQRNPQSVNNPDWNHQYARR